MIAASNDLMAILLATSVQTTARRLYDLLVELAARSVGVKTRALSRASGAKSLSAPLDRPQGTIRGA